MPPRTRTPRATIIALANQKGGVAKTTSVASLGAAFAELGKRVLLVDLDPQACLTFSLGVDPEAVEASIHDVLIGAASLDDVIVRCAGVDLVPSSIDLAGTEAVLLSRPGREYLLQALLAEKAAAYDLILLDCAPSLGVLTLNALTAATADSHLIVEGIAAVALLVQRYYLTRRRFATVARSAPPILRTVRFAEAPAVGRSILETSRNSKGAQAYRAVAKDILQRLSL